MSKQLRIEFPGAVYHALSKGYKGKNIFREDKDFLRFQKNLSDVKEKFGIKIYAYVIMSNHFHLLIETPKANLSKVMQSLKLRYANYYNLKHSDMGKVFHKEYKAIVVEKDSYFLEVFRYILLNPFRARAVDKLHKYRWSSYREYLTSGKLTDTEDVLGMFGNEEQTAVRKIREHVIAGMEKDLKHWRMELYSDHILGRNDFITEVREKFREKKKNPEVVLSRNLKDFDIAEKILREVCEEYKIDISGLEGKRGSENEARKVAINLICNKTGLSNKEIAKFFNNIHYSTLSHMRARVESNRVMKKKADNIWSKIVKYTQDKTWY